MTIKSARKLCRSYLLTLEDPLNLPFREGRDFAPEFVWISLGHSLIPCSLVGAENSAVPRRVACFQQRRRPERRSTDRNASEASPTMSGLAKVVFRSC